MKEYVIIYAQPFDKDAQNRVLLVLKDKPSWQKNYFNTPGGKVEPNESPCDAALRELYEETGLKSSIAMIMGEILCPKEEIVYCYLVNVDHNQGLAPRHEETEKVAWMDWNQVSADKRLLPSLRIILPLMMNGVYDWTLQVDETMMGKDSCTVRLTVLSENSFEETAEINQVIERLKK